MNQITTTRPTPRIDRQQKTGDPVAVDPAPSTCDIALEGMIVLLARHISREMTAVDDQQEKNTLCIKRTEKAVSHSREG